MTAYLLGLLVLVAGLFLSPVLGLAAVGLALLIAFYAVALLADVLFWVVVETLLLPYRVYRAEFHPERNV